MVQVVVLEVFGRLVQVLGEMKVEVVKWVVLVAMLVDVRETVKEESECLRYLCYRAMQNQSM